MSATSYLIALGLGPAEIGVLLLVAVFVFGPRRIPEIGESFGKAISSFKKATAADDEDDKKPPSEGKELAEDTTKEKEKIEV